MRGYKLNILDGQQIHDAKAYGFNPAMSTLSIASAYHPFRETFHIARGGDGLNP